MCVYPVKFSPEFKEILAAQISESNKQMGLFNPKTFEAFGYFFEIESIMKIRVQMYPGERWAGASVLHFPAMREQLTLHGCEIGNETTSYVADQKLHMPGGMEIVFDFLQNFNNPLPA